MGFIEFIDVDKNFIHWENRPDNIKKILVDIISGRFRMGKKSRVPVLKNVNFKIGPGEFVGIMGKNGAGKSTVLKMISRIYKPDSGIVNVQGKVAPLLSLGAGFSEELSGYENIFLNGAILGFSRTHIHQVLDKIIEFSELGEKINMPIKNYSSGMLVRLAFSIAAYLDASILLFDEVLAVGDLGFQIKCLQKITELHQQGRTVVLVAHSPEQIRAHCNRAIVIDNKTVVFDGSPQDAAKIYEGWF